ncbi:ANGPT4 [Mytilus coruscus]|uniref:ANGPT4 n=1 Tax=Mytilus coruscus TaxID=42192 RepID=A0A6J8CEM5_MYTCO|nr:ANGPT4 [Mytilus coruscus]
MHMIRIVVAVLLFSVASIAKVDCNSFSITFKTRITSYETIIETITVPTSVACARECTRNDCCTACYNKTTNKCHLHSDCFPVSEHSDSGVFIRKNDVKTSNDATTQDTKLDRTTLENTSDKPTTNDETPYKESDVTTTMKPTVRDITGSFKTTSDKRSTATSIERTTENEPVAMIIDCSEIPSGSLSGIYTIYVDNQANDVYCEMRSDGQWTVIQKRLNGTTDFYRNWQEYKQGFGNVNLEHWLGNDNLHKILSAKNYKLRIDLKDWNGNAKYADYNTFVVGSEDTNYTLTISGYSGDAGKCRNYWLS